MIEVERMNGQKMLINPDLVTMIEITPDTVISFTDGNKIILRTKPDEIVKRIIQFRKESTGLPEIKKS